MSKLTSKQYVDNGGTLCPFCKSEAIEGSRVEVDAGTAWQEMRCHDCERMWQDDYKLVGYLADPRRA